MVHNVKWYPYVMMETSRTAVLVTFNNNMHLSLKCSLTQNGITAAGDVPLCELRTIT